MTATARRHREQVGRVRRGGVGQYWVVDPFVRKLTAYTDTVGAWETTAILNERNPVVTVEIEDVAVELDLAGLLPR